MDKEKQEHLETWIREYSDTLYTWASYKLNDADLAKDLVQDTLISALQAWDRFEGRSSIKTWLTSILNNKIRDHYRKNKNRMFSLDEMAGERPIDDFFDSNGGWKPEHRPQLWGEDDAALLDQTAFRDALYSCINGLSDRFKNVMVGKYLEKKESADLCQDLGISATNFWQILHRAKVQLRNCLDSTWFKHAE